MVSINIKRTKKQYKNIKKRNTVLLLLYFFLAIAFLSSIMIMIIIFYASRDLPSVNDLKNYKTNFTTRMYSNDGVLLNSYSIENRIFISIEEIPKIIKDAFLSAEDANFYEHGGIDVIGIMKASYKNLLFFIFKEGQIVGASTITQQVVKNILLTNERTIMRKVKEIILSIELSKALSKEEILEIYLNHIYLGSGAYGVMAASIEYFGKNIKDLTLEEVAVLAALPKAPSDINPRRRKERATDRRNWVLNRMYENKFITVEQYKQAISTPIKVKPQTIMKENLNGVNSFSDYIKSSISAVYGSDAFFSGGYFVKTTLNYKIQEALYESFRGVILNYDKKNGYREIAGSISTKSDICLNLNNFIEDAEIKDISLEYAVISSASQEGLFVIDKNCIEGVIPTNNFTWSLKRFNEFKAGDVIVMERTKDGLMLSQLPQINGGAIVINPTNGDVLGMIGDFFDRPNGFNRAIFAKRQFGSTVKPFVYITALENGFTPSSILVDEDLKLSDEWQPRNASRDFLGSVTLRVALERSRNVPTVRVAEILGTNKIIRKFNDFDLNTEKLEPDLTTTLGSFNTTVERVAKAYSVFVNKGKKVDTHFINKIQNYSGKNIFTKDGTCISECFDKNITPNISKQIYGERVTSEERAFQILSMLEGAVQRGTSRGMFPVSNFGIGGKTGSTNDHKDAWFAGFTNELLIVVYIGSDKPKSLGENQYGAVLALPVARSFFSILKSKGLANFTPFEIPENITQIEVDYITGNPATAKTERKIVESFTKEDAIPKLKLNFEDAKIEDLHSIDINDLEKTITEGIY